MIVPSQKTVATLIFRMILIFTYYDFLRILLFLEIWFVIKEAGIGNTLSI